MVVILVVGPGAGWAVEPLFGPVRASPLPAAAAPLIQAGKPLVALAPVSRNTPGSSLFAGRAKGGLFAPVPPRVQDRLASPVPKGRSARARFALRNLIAMAEAGIAGYDAVQQGARIRPGKPPTQMTLAEVFAWIEATPGQPHAIGRYQFIPKTLSRLVRQAGLGPETRFTPLVQDRLADLLLDEAGIEQALSGGLGEREFMRNLARIWAGLPLPNGKSYYQGYAGNKAVMSWARFQAGVGRAMKEAG